MSSFNFDQNWQVNLRPRREREREIQRTRSKAVRISIIKKLKLLVSTPLKCCLLVVSSITLSLYLITFDFDFDFDFLLLPAETTDPAILRHQYSSLQSAVCSYCLPSNVEQDLSTVCINKSASRMLIFVYGNLIAVYKFNNRSIKTCSANASCLTYLWHVSSNTVSWPHFLSLSLSLSLSTVTSVVVQLDSRHIVITTCWSNKLV